MLKRNAVRIVKGVAVVASCAMLFVMYHHMMIIIEYFMTDAIPGDRAFSYGLSLVGVIFYISMRFPRMVHLFRLSGSNKDHSNKEQSNA